MFEIVDKAREIGVWHGDRPAVHVIRDIGRYLEEVIGPDAGRAWNGGTAGVHHGYHAVLARHGNIGRVFIGRCKIAKSRLGKPNALSLHLGEIIFGQPRLQDDRAGVNAHAARPVALEGFTRCYCQRLDAGRIARPARHMHFRRADARRHSAVNIAFEEADGFLARGIIAEGDVDMGIDQARHGHHARGVDGNVAAGDIAAAADRDQLSIGHEDRVARHNRCREIAAENFSDVEDGGLHRITQPCP